QAIQATLKQTLNRVKEHGNEIHSYASGNLLNIARQLGISPAGWDFSRLAIREADIRYMNMSKVTCTRCSFSNTAFASGLQHDLVAGLHPDGQYVAIGDAKGRLVVWQYRQERFFLLWAYSLKHAVKAIAFGLDGSLAVATNDVATDNYVVQLWWQIETTSEPQYECPVSTAIQNLCISSNGTYLAIGLANGQILVWDLLADKQHRHLEVSRSPIRHMAFSPDSKYLSSCGEDGRLLSWGVETSSCRSEMELSPYHTLLTLGWSQQRPLAIEGSPEGLHIRRIRQSVQTLATPEGITYYATLSNNACYLASSNDNLTVQLWDLSKNKAKTFTGFIEPPTMLAVSNDGALLLSNTRSQVQIWDTVRQRCLREFSALHNERLYEGFNGKEASGIPKPVHRIATSLGAIL
ncbi:MAG: WD40 repeat domain-containing protein, partial [Cyanothece sp. SIO1E1]|nr:WD40 repeat domain-containing protein [Cyanothece sp. SIO1E1]